MTTIAEYERWLRRVLTGYTWTFALWGCVQTLFVAAVMGDAFDGASIGWLGVVNIAAFLPWGFYLVRYLNGLRRYWRNPDIRRAVGDERAITLQRHAFSIAFWSVMAVLVAVICVYTVFRISLSPLTLASGVIWIGVTAAMVSYLILDGRDEA